MGMRVKLSKIIPYFCEILACRGEIAHKLEKAELAPVFSFEHRF